MRSSLVCRVGLPAAAVAVACALPLLGARHASAAPPTPTTYLVTTADDPASNTACPAVTGNTPKPCTLRAAVAAANAAGGNVIITFGVPGPFVLAGGQLFVDGGESLTIRGASSGTVVDGGNASRVFAVSDANSINQGCGTTPTSLTLVDMVVTHGLEAATLPPDDGFGGAIDVNCANTLALVDSVLSDSKAARGGGGINDNTTGAVMLLRSTISGNTAQGTTAALDDGGGVATNTAAALLIVDSTITGNISGSYGGGIAAITGGTVTIVNSTISGNTAGGTGAGGVFAAANASVGIANSIVAKNTTANCAGTVTDNGHNLENGTSCTFSASAVNADPKLGPLQANGGVGATMALQPGSPAIRAGDDAICAAKSMATPAGADAKDERGATRPQSTHCDIGAFEVVATTTSLSAPSTATPGQSVTLTATVTPAQTIPGDPTGTVTFLDGTTVLGTAPLSAGSNTASLTTSSLAAGAHSLTARFEQTSLFLTSTSAATQLVVAAPTTPTPTPTATIAPPPTGGAPLWPLGAALGGGGGLLAVLALATRRRRR